jgi:hypothetical protein
MSQRIYSLGTGNIAFNGNNILTTNNKDISINNNIVPTLSTFSIGAPGNPLQELFLAANSLSLATNQPGASAITMSNDGNSFTVQNGGLRSTIIYTGGLLLSGNNIGADPLVSNLPMTIGTNGLPALQILVPTTSISTISTTNVMYASGGNSNLWNSAYNNQTNYLPISGGTLTGSLTASSALIGKDFSNFTVVSTVTNTTAISADFSKDALIHLHAYKNGTINSVSSPLKITPINFTAGSTIDILIYNPLPGNGVVYMDWGGVNASFPNYQNSSGAPYIVALSSISTTQTYHFKYICIDGTLTNTFIIT